MNALIVSQQAVPGTGIVTKVFLYDKSRKQGHAHTFSLAANPGESLKDFNIRYEAGLEASLNEKIASL